MQREMETRQRVQSTAGKMKKNLQGFLKIDPSPLEEKAKFKGYNIKE